MDLVKLAETLQDAEIAVLRSFRKSNVNAIESLKGLSRVEFMRAGMWLENKGLIETKRSSRKIVILDAYGKKYVKSTLPEIKLISLIKKQDLSIEELSQKLSRDELHFAIGYLKKKGFIRFEQGVVSITPAGKRLRLTPEGILILRIAKTGELDLLNLDDDELKAYSALSKRKQVIKTLEKQIINFKVTQTGKNIIPYIPTGKRIGNLTPSLIKNKAWDEVPFRRFDVSAQVPTVYPGKKQPYNQFTDSVRQKLVEMGFKEMTGPLIETEFWNFDALYQPQNHPARDWTDTYSLKHPKYGKLPNQKLVSSVKLAHEKGGETRSTGWQYKWDSKKASKLMPRAHGTSLSARWLAKGVEVPGKYFATARVYRPDVLDSTHLIEFNQIDGIIIDKSLNFKKLLGLLKQFALEFAGTDKVRFLPDYYPFVEPGVQMDVYNEKLGKWVELGGAGIFRPELTKALGVKEPVIAWGLGLDRFAMSKLGIKDIRHLFSHDLDWIRGEKVV